MKETQTLDTSAPDNIISRLQVQIDEPFNNSVTWKSKYFT